MVKDSGPSFFGTRVDPDTIPKQIKLLLLTIPRHIVFAVLLAKPLQVGICL